MGSGAVVRSRSGTVRAGGPPGNLRESPAAVFSAVSAGVRMQRQYLCERLPSYQEQGGEKARGKMLNLACACNGGWGIYRRGRRGRGPPPPPRPTQEPVGPPAPRVDPPADAGVRLRTDS